MTGMFLTGMFLTGERARVEEGGGVGDGGHAAAVDP
jgi:hypothetical protein